MKKVLTSVAVLAVLFMASLATYAQVCVPSIVYTQKFSNQTSAIGATTVFTPTSDGLFRISIVGDINGSGAAEVSTETWWSGTASLGTSPYFQVLSYINGNSTLSGNTTYGSFFVGKAGVPIQFQARILNSSGLTDYNLYVVLEQLK